ncbi:MAG: M61 family metallopeptidase [Nitrososphaerota archaeon]|nr:M61 family metallopeptidase [Nitrososphaerota archaeon]
MENPGTHCFKVRMTVGPVDGGLGTLGISMPVWTPGSYLVREFARNVLSIRASDARGKDLAVEKVSKCRWLVGAGSSERVEVEYTVYAFAFSVNTSYLDTEHAIINGASVFLYAEGFEKNPVIVHLAPYSGWKTVSTGMERMGEDWTFVAADYDILVDSPIEMGNLHVHQFHAMEARHEVSIFAQKAIDEESLVSDIRKIVESTVPIFGDVPYRRYVFLVDFAGEGWGGLEHLNSTHCIGSYYWLEPPEEYRSFLTLFSHEFFHTWNVKRMRPVALGPFDYSGENYTKSLWISEGITSYYEAVILRRAGILPVPEYLEELVDNINPVRSLPSGRAQSPEESSFDSWVRLYRQDENSPNVSPSYYRQGAVMGMLLDLQIRHASDNAKSLDDVMRRVYRETYIADGRGFTDEQFRKACSDASGGQTEATFDAHVSGRMEVDWDRYLGYAGLRLVQKATPSRDEGFLGIRLKAGPSLTVATRLTESPAEMADLSAGDEILATDGLRTDAQRLPFYIANRKPGTEVELTIVRAGMLKNVRVILGPRPNFEYRIVKKEAASEEEKQTFALWAIENWSEPLLYRDHRISPVRQRVLDYV